MKVITRNIEVPNNYKKYGRWYTHEWWKYSWGFIAGLVFWAIITSILIICL